MLSDNLLLENKLRDLQDDHTRASKRHADVEAELSNIKKAYESASKNLEHLSELKKQTEHDFEQAVDDKDNEISRLLDRVNVLQRQNRDMELKV